MDVSGCADPVCLSVCESVSLAGSCCGLALELKPLNWLVESRWKVTKVVHG